LTASRREREKAALAEWADARDIILRATGFATRPSHRQLAQLFAPYGIIRDINSKKRKTQHVYYLTLLGSARRAFRACRALSAHAHYRTGKAPQFSFAARNPKDVTVINGLLMAYASRYHGTAATARRRQRPDDQPGTTSYMLHLGWLWEPVTNQQVAEFFADYGRASLVKLMVNRSCVGHPRTFGVINLRTTSIERAADACVNLTGRMLGGSVVEVASLRKFKVVLRSRWSFAEIEEPILFLRALAMII
jgi:hypothetical protein